MRYEVYNDYGHYVCTDRFPARFGNGNIHGTPLRVLYILDEGEIKYDVSNIAYAQGDIARVHDNYGHDLLGDNKEHLMHQWIDICEDGNIDRVRRVIAQSISEVEHELFRYAYRSNLGNISLDNQPRKSTEYLVDLCVPSTFPESSSVYLLRLIHEYIVNSVLEDWASITYPEAQARWGAKKQETLQKMCAVRGLCGSQHKVNPSII